MTITGGSTSFVLTESAAAALKAYDISLEPVAPAKAVAGATAGVSVPVEAGSIVPVPFQGSLNYGAGGFRFVDTQQHKIEFTKGQTDLTRGTATAVVDGDATKRIALGTYAVDPTKVKADAMTVSATGTEVKLTSEGATAVNTAFGEQVFKAGDKLFDGSSNLKIGTPLGLSPL
ncbi:hypothetical protein AB0F18_21665 [Streptomyces sp. NPDC029216]|uniref:hypothetical protein n=1 Tax=Streptomyces sp. NPDC029216 TaxID=3154701 RepID=UPI0033CA923D